MTEHNLRVSARTLRASEGDDGPPWRFGGVAVAAGDILHMDDGTRVLFTEENLKAAAETQAGEPLTVDHPEDGNGNPQYPPPTDETIGKVAKAGWVDDAEGLAYEATTHDQDIARGVQAGTYDVSVHPTFRTEPYDGADADVKAVDINFRDLSTVSKGDSPSNTAEYGPNEALASWTAETDFSELEGGEPVTPDEPADFDSFGRKVWNRLFASESEDADSDTNEPAESGADEDTDMGNEETPEDDPEAPNGDPDDGTDTTPEDQEPTIADMTVSELGSALKEQGFVTEDNAAEFVEQATAQATKSDKVDEIIAESDDYDEDDREDLMASADALVDSEHDRVTGTTGQRIPGNAGARDSVTAGFSEGEDEDLDEYGTGVAGE